TAPEPEPPAAAAAWFDGPIETAHAADCVTVNVRPPTPIVPVRAPPPFAATVNAIVPLPLPDAPLVIEIHDAVDEAVQEQTAGAVTVKLPDPPLDPTDWLDGAIENAHDTAACETVNVFPAIVRVPV